MIIANFLKLTLVKSADKHCCVYNYHYFLHDYLDLNITIYKLQNWPVNSFYEWNVIILKEVEKENFSRKYLLLCYICFLKGKHESYC